MTSSVQTRGRGRLLLAVAAMALSLAGAAQAQPGQDAPPVIHLPPDPPGTLPHMRADRPPPSMTQTPPDFSGMWMVNYRASGFNDGKPLPYKPWAKAIFDQSVADSNANKNWGLNRIFCLPDGPVDLMYTPYLTQIVQQPNEILLLMEYANQERTIRMNAQHPAKLSPSWYGDSVGHWEGNTLVVDTVGVNELASLMTQARLVTPRQPGPPPVAGAAGPSFNNMPHSAALHMVERIHLAADGKQLVDEMTIDDPKAYTQPIPALISFGWRPDIRPDEFICADAPLDLAG